MQLRDEYVRNGQSLAEERLGTILHEMIHGFLFQYACEPCTASADNVKNHGGHGRAWQLIAKAVEDEASRLLGTEVDLGGSTRCIRSWCGSRTSRACIRCMIWKCMGSWIGRAWVVGDRLRWREVLRYLEC